MTSVRARVSAGAGRHDMPVRWTPEDAPVIPGSVLVKGLHHPRIIYSTEKVRIAIVP